MTHRREEGIHPVVAASTRQASIVAFENPVLNNVCHALSLCLWNGRPCEIWTLITLFQVFLDTLVRMNAQWRQGYGAPNFNYDPSQCASVRSGLISMKSKWIHIHENKTVRRRRRSIHWITRNDTKWRSGVSIPVPLACKASALPCELHPHRLWVCSHSTK